MPAAELRTQGMDVRELMPRGAMIENVSITLAGYLVTVGVALLWVTPLCATEDANRASYIAPAAEQRRVIVGDTISLGAVEIVVVVTTCGETQPCICG